MESSWMGGFFPLMQGATVEQVRKRNHVQVLTSLRSRVYVFIFAQVRMEEVGPLVGKLIGWSNGWSAGPSDLLNTRVFCVTAPA